MFTFAAKPRTIRIRSGASLVIPSSIKLEATLGPEWLFGETGGAPPRFILAGSTGVSIFFDANTGRHYMQGGSQPSAPTAILQTATGLTVKLIGRVASFEFVASSLDEIAINAEVLLFSLPAILNVYLPYPCVVDHVIGTSAGGEFGYEIENIGLPIPLVDQAKFNADADTTLRDLTSLSGSSNARLFAALSYFYRATRLVEAGHTPWEFSAESVLNLAKCLETLFPPLGNVNTRDAVRAGLQSNGLASSSIETWFVPALVLRSSLDVAHVKLAQLERTHVESLARYVGGAIQEFRRVLQHLLAQAVAGTGNIGSYTMGPVEGSALASLSALEERLRNLTPSA